MKLRPSRLILALLLAAGAATAQADALTDQAKRLSLVNLLSGIRLVVVGGVAVYDSLVGYRRSLRVAPVVGEGTVGLSAAGHF